MGKIKLLTTELANKIAAGEVVERPASVVKELVENALDAESTIIEVELLEAGLKKIRVIDNGTGMTNEDCLLAFLRHATSKIENEHDLFRIRTLGFRGEALPSIASVSHFDLKTSTGEDAGTHVRLVGGQMVINERTNSRKGTDISVEQLFFNTPARLKYMKTLHTELGNVTDYLNRIALAHPHVSFRLLHEGRTIFHTSGNGNIQQVLAGIYGVPIAKKMIPILMESLDFRINGFLTLPEITRSSRNYMSVMINGRYVKNYPLMKAIEAGYYTLLPIGRYPIVLLHIQMDPILIDVNVHPAKWEVRISKEAALHHLVEASIRNEFKKQVLIPEVTARQPKPKVDTQQSFSLQHTPRETIVESKEIVFERREQPMYVKEEMPIEEMWEVESLVHLLGKEPIAFEQFQDKHIMEKIPIEKDSHTVEPRVPVLYPIGQMHGTYILAQNENGLYIIDQHAAQERIFYEFYREKLGQVEKELQQMLVPFTFQYPLNEYLLIEQHQQLLKECGVFLEPFGEHCFIVRSHPQWFPKGEETTIIEEMIEQVVNIKKVDITKLRESSAIMMSCKKSIKANEHLRNDEIFALLERLRTTSDPFTCPHGRPIIVTISTYEMEKMFKRVM